MRAHIIESGFVINTVEVDDFEFPVGSGQSLIDGAIGGIGWRYEGGQLLEPEDHSHGGVQEGEQTIFGTRDYLKRFTMAEYAAARRAESVEVQWALDNMIAAQYIDIEDPETVAGLDLMVSHGVLTAGRRDELLSPKPPQE